MKTATFVFILSFVWGIFFPLSLFSLNFQARTQNLQKENQDTQLLLALEEIPEQTFEYQIDIRIKLLDSPILLHRKTFYLKIENTQPIEIPLHLGKGTFQIEVSILNTEKGELQNFSLSHACRPKTEDFYASDIFLAYDNPLKEGLISTILATKLEEGSSQIYFYQEIAASIPTLTARAVLYQEMQAGVSVKTTTYTSVEQLNEVLNIVNGKAVFSNKFSLLNLPSGKYLLEILIYSDTKQLAERNISFELEWNGWAKVWENIDESIRKMKYILPQSQIDSLLSIPSPVQKKKKMLQIWEDLYPNMGELEAKKYFEKQQWAAEKFKEEGNILDSERARIWTLYGQPTEIQDFTENENVYQRWIYSQWALTFVFRRKGAHYVEEKIE